MTTGGPGPGATGAGGGLPAAARHRLEGAARVWSSAQPLGQEAALRQLGLTPVGVVIGSANSWGVALAPRSTRGRRRRTKLPPPPDSQWQPTSLDDPVTARRHGGYVHDWKLANDDPSSRHVGWTWELVMHERRELELIDTVLSDLIAEASALGAHGVVGVTLDRRHLGVERGGEYPILEMVASGTAVTSLSAPAVVPFSTGLSGTDLLKLARRGWAPVRLVAGIGHVRGVRRRSSRRTLVSSRSTEVHQLSELRQKSLELAVRSIEHRAPPDSGIVLAVERTMAEEHLEVQTRLTGSAVRRVTDATSDRLNYRMVVNLNR